MTPEELPNPPRKVSWKRWALASAVVLAVTTFVLLTKSANTEPVAVWFVGYTNYDHFKLIVCKGSNGVPREITFCACVITNSIHPVKTVWGLSPLYGWALHDPPARSTFEFNLNAGPRDTPYYIAWAFLDNRRPATRGERFRMRCHDFFSDHRMPRLARLFEPRVHVHYIPSTDLKE